MLADSVTNDIYYAVDHVENEYTATLRRLRVNINSPGEDNNTLECLGDNLDQDFKGWLRVDNTVKHKSTRRIIHEADFIKIGRQVLQIAKIHIAKSSNTKGAKSKQNNQSNEDRVSNIEAELLEADHNDSKNDVRCRICLEPETDNNPFEGDLCFCSKKMPAHFRCLTEWLKRKCQMQTLEHMTLYDIGNMKCDVCAQTYPLDTNIEGESRKLLVIEGDQDTSHAVVNVYSLDTFGARIVAVINLNEKTKAFKLGRAEDNEIVFKDISISRLHAYLIWEDGELSLYDNCSKFGTFVMLPKRVSLSEVVGKHVLIDKFCFSFMPQYKRGKGSKIDDVVRDPVSRYNRLYLPREQVSSVANLDRISTKNTEASSLQGSNRRERQVRGQVIQQNQPNRMSPGINRLGDQMLRHNLIDLNLHNPFNRIEEVSNEDQHNNTLRPDAVEENRLSDITENTKLNKTEEKPVDPRVIDKSDKSTEDIDEIKIEDQAKNKLICRTLEKKKINSLKRQDLNSLVQAVSFGQDKSLEDRKKRALIIEEVKENYDNGVGVRIESDLGSTIRFGTNTEPLQFN